VLQAIISENTSNQKSVQTKDLWVEKDIRRC